MVFAGALAYPRQTPPTETEMHAPLRHLLQSVGANPPASEMEEAASSVSGLQQQAALATARQSRRLPLLRSYLESRQLLAEAWSAADRALDALVQDEHNLRQRAEQQVSEAREALLQARVQGDKARLQASGRQALVQHGITLQEAERSLARGAYRTAALKASQVVQGSRTWHDDASATLARLGDAEAVAEWQRWVRETVAWSARHRDTALVVNKQKRQLLLYDSGTLLTTFDVDLGLNPVPDKIQEGDNATPEGRYRVSEVRAGNSTRYYRAFMLNYPNEEDWHRFRAAKAAGRVPEDADIGSLIEIHGYGGRGDDWTNGCVALSNREMDFLEGWVEEGTPVTIVGALPATPRASNGRISATGGGQQ